MMQNLSGGPEWYNSLSQSKQHEIIINLQKFNKQEFIQKYVTEFEIEPEEVMAFLSWWKKNNTNVSFFVFQKFFKRKNHMIFFCVFKKYPL